MNIATKQKGIVIALFVCVLCMVALSSVRTTSFEEAFAEPGVAGGADAATGADAAAGGEADGPYGPKASATGVPGMVSPIPQNEDSYVPGELIVGLNDAGADGGDIQEVCRAIESTGAVVTEVLTHASDYAGTTLLVSTDGSHLTGDALAAAARAIASQQGISYVQPNYNYTASAGATPQVNDTDFAEQYYLNDWESDPSRRGANAAAAWEQVATGERVDVAVLDTGIYVMQEFDSAGANRIVNHDNFHQEFDDDNLSIEDGRDFVHSVQGDTLLPLVNDENPFGDDSGHGTHVSGIIAAHASIGDSSSVLPVGMAGVSQNARIIPLKVLDAAGLGSTDNFVKAYDYLLKKVSNNELDNLHVINLSLSQMVSKDGNLLYGNESETDGQGEGENAGNTGSGNGEGETPVDPAFQQRIQAAEQQGIVTVCAVGNKASSGQVCDSYPAIYEECVSVTALNEDGTDASYANNNGDEDIAAPGTGIYSSWGSQADAYATFDGTSQATAIVSGVMSMMWAKDPSLTVDEAKAILHSTAHEVPNQAQGSASSGASTLSGASVDSNKSESSESLAGHTASEGASQAEADSADSGLASAQANTGSTLVAGSIASGSEVKRHYAVDAAAALSEVKLNAKRTRIASSATSLGSFEYTGSEIKPKVTVYAEGGTTALTDAVDNEVNYSDNVRLGTGKAIVSGKGSYRGVLRFTFKITPITLTKEAITLSQTSMTYTGKALEPAVTVKVKGVTLEKDTDYTVAYSNNTNVGTATVTVTGKGNYQGTVKSTFTIVKKETDNPQTQKTALTAVSVPKASYVYTGKALRPAVTVKAGGTTLKSGDYTVSYANNTNVGTATVTVTGKGNYQGTVKTTFKVAKKTLVKGMVSLSKTKYVYTGKALKPAVTVKIGKTKVAAKNYKVKYSANKNPGKATVKVTGKGNLGSQTVSLTFKILPMPTTLRKVSAGEAGSRAFTVTWKKQAKQTTGYQLRYSPKSNMSGAKTKTIAKNKTTKLKVAKLKKRTYYVQVRTYKKVGKAKYYSAWSKKKPVKVK